MDKVKIVNEAANRLGDERCHNLLAECSIDLASALLQREGAMRDESPDPDLIDSLNSAVDGRIADLLIAIDIVCVHRLRCDVIAELEKRWERLFVQNKSDQLP